jgi:hypothetical protein
VGANGDSGPAGVKLDDVELDGMDMDGDLDVVTAGRYEQPGIVRYESYPGLAGRPVAASFPLI